MPDRWSLRLGRLALAAAIVAVVACATTPERLPELDRRFYYNLPTPEAQGEFLRLPDEDRQAFLESQGLWRKWTALPAEEREAAGKGEIQVGFHEFAVFMAWGPPADTQTRDRNERPILVHTFIRCSSGPKAGRYVRNNLDCDGTSTEREVAIRDGLVAEIIYER
jgi:hypothetical protein